jgi:hypothetical protein
MKLRAIFLTGLLAAAIAQNPGVAASPQEDDGMVAGSGAGVFPADASFAGVALSSLQFGHGVLADSGSTVGAFHAVLFGTSGGGQFQQITVEGKVDAGLFDGANSFSGTASVDLGLGGQLLTAVPFTVTVGADSLQLVLAGTSLPAAALAVGALAND